MKYFLLFDLFLFISNSFFSKAGIIDSFEGTSGHLGTQGHQGPITGVDTHSAFGQVPFFSIFFYWLHGKHLTNCYCTYLYEVLYYLFRKGGKKEPSRHLW